MAQCRLPFSFNVLAKLPPELRQRLLTTQGKKRRAHFEREEGTPPGPEPSLIPPPVGDVNVVTQSDTPNSGQVDHAVDQPVSLLGVQSSEDSLSRSPTLVRHPQPRWINAGPTSNPLPAQQSPMQAPRSDGEPIPTLTEVNPESGSITGGTRIWLKGIDFPIRCPLFVRFGTTVVPTVSSMGRRFCPHLQSNCSDFLCQQPSCL